MQHSDLTLGLLSTYEWIFFAPESDRHTCLLKLTRYFPRASFYGFCAADGVPAGWLKRSDHALQMKLWISGERRWGHSILHLYDSLVFLMLVARFEHALLCRSAHCHPDKGQCSFRCFSGKCTIHRRANKSRLLSGGGGS